MKETVSRKMKRIVESGLYNVTYIMGLLGLCVIAAVTVLYISAFYFVGHPLDDLFVSLYNGDPIGAFNLVELIVGLVLVVCHTILSLAWLKFLLGAISAKFVEEIEAVVKARSKYMTKN